MCSQDTIMSTVQILKQKHMETKLLSPHSMLRDAFLVQPGLNDHGDDGDDDDDYF